MLGQQRGVCGVKVKDEIFRTSPQLDNWILNRKVRSLVSALKYQAKLIPTARWPSERKRAIKEMDQNRGCNPREAMTDTKWRYFCEEQRGTYQSPRWGIQGPLPWSRSQQYGSLPVSQGDSKAERLVGLSPAGGLQEKYCDYLDFLLNKHFYFRPMIAMR
jgi:hypothetical protein